MGVVFCLSDWKLLEPRESLPLSPASSLSHSGVRGGGLGLHIHLQWQTLDTVSSWRPLPPPACLQVQCAFSKADVLAGKVLLEGCPEAPTLDSDAGAAGHLPHGVLSQTGVGAIVLREGVLDVELGHASLAGGAGVLDGLSWGGKHSRAQAREQLAEGWEAAAVMMLGFPTLAQAH